MEIKDNVIKYHLKNVYFICGTACAGKTTMSKMLAEKYGYYLYDMDKMYQKHRAIAEANYQPDMCYHMKDYHEQWMRPVEETADWNISSIEEQTDMVLLDLIKLSENKKVIADVLYSPAYKREIVDYNQIIFLTVNRNEIRKSYFNRPEKRSFYEFVKTKPLADTYFENIFQGLELTNDLEQKMIKQSGLLMLERNVGDTKEDMLQKIEKHFKLI